MNLQVGLWDSLGFWIFKGSCQAAQIFAPEELAGVSLRSLGWGFMGSYKLGYKQGDENYNPADFNPLITIHEPPSGLVAESQLSKFPSIGLSSTSFLHF